MAGSWDFLALHIYLILWTISWLSDRVLVKKERITELERNFIFRDFLLLLFLNSIFESIIDDVRTHQSFFWIRGFRSRIYRTIKKKIILPLFVVFTAISRKNRIWQKFQTPLKSLKIEKKDKVSSTIVWNCIVVFYWNYFTNSILLQTFYLLVYRRKIGQ